MEMLKKLKLGAGAIAEELYGEDNEENRRKVYYLDGLGVLPTFRVGSLLALNPDSLEVQLRELEAEGVEEQRRRRELARTEAETELRRTMRRRGRRRARPQSKEKRTASLARE
jgi:hypothetical protein